MEFVKKNIKTIIGFIIGVVLASSITVYAYNYIASDVKYTDDKSVEDALNDLYNKKKAIIITNYEIVADGTNYTFCELGFTPTFIFIDTGTEKYWWKSGSTAIYFANPKPSGTSGSTCVYVQDRVTTSNTGFNYKLDSSNNGKIVTLYAIK